MRRVLGGLWVVGMLASLAGFLTPWKIGVFGFRFPYHGVPSLALTVAAALVGGAALVRWRRGLAGRLTWIVAGGVSLLAAGFQAAFFLESDTTTATGHINGPDGLTPIQFQLSIPSQWGVYFATGASALTATISLGLAILVPRRNELPPGPTDAA